MRILVKYRLVSARFLGHTLTEKNRRMHFLISVDKLSWPVVSGTMFGAQSSYFEQTKFKDAISVQLSSVIFSTSAFSAACKRLLKICLICNGLRFIQNFIRPHHYAKREMWPIVCYTMFLGLCPSVCLSVCLSQPSALALQNG